MNHDRGQEEIWMLAFEAKSSNHYNRDEGVYTEPKYGYFASEEEAKGQIENTRDGKNYYPYRISLGGITPLVQNVSTEPLDLSEMSKGTIYATEHYEGILDDSETLKTFAQFALPNREAKAIQFICDYGHLEKETYYNECGDEDTTYYNIGQWVMSEVAKILTGENYPSFKKHEEVNWGDFADSNYEIEIYPMFRNLDLDYEKYVLPNSGLSALIVLSRMNDENEYYKALPLDQAARILTGKNYDKLVADSGIEWEVE